MWFCVLDCNMNFRWSNVWFFVIGLYKLTELSQIKTKVNKTNCLWFLHFFRLRINSNTALFYSFSQWANHSVLSNRTSSKSFKQIFLSISYMDPQFSGRIFPASMEINVNMAVTAAFIPMSLSVNIKKTTKLVSTGHVLTNTISHWNFSLLKLSSTKNRNFPTIHQAPIHQFQRPITFLEAVQRQQTVQLSLTNFASIPKNFRTILLKITTKWMNNTN